MANNRFDNRERVFAKMRAIPVQVRIAARSGCDAQAAFLVEQIRPHVPVEHGDLADSLEWHRNPNPTKIGVIITEGVTDDPEKKRKARAVEFGRPDMAAQPHFYPVYRAFKKQMRRAMNKITKAAIQKAVS